MRTLSVSGVVAVLAAMLAALVQWYFAFGPWLTLGPHRFCWLNRPELVWGNFVSDEAIGWAYTVIPFPLVLLAYRGHIPFPSVAYLFACFIFACGAGHHMEAVTIWVPAYYMALAVKAVTAVVSVACAIVTVIGYCRVRAEAPANARMLQAAADVLDQHGSAFGPLLRGVARGISG